MASNVNKKKNTIFLILFLVLTVFCWCPIGYGSYGEVGLIMGMPSWAFFMLLIGAVLFVIEWVYLFRTDLALYDEDLEGIMAALEKTIAEEAITEKTVVEEN
jgi:membrane protein implicated in regulation of membrane protease activity